LDLERKMSFEDHITFSSFNVNLDTVYKKWDCSDPPITLEIFDEIGITFTISLYTTHFVRSML